MGIFQRLFRRRVDISGFSQPDRITDCQGCGSSFQWDSTFWTEGSPDCPACGYNNRTGRKGSDVDPAEQSYPQLADLRNDLSLLPPLMLENLKKMMFFIVLDGGKEHVATIVRVPSSEFPKDIQTTPRRLYIALIRTRHGDMFSLYYGLADPRHLWWTETWISPYEDETPESSPTYPLDKEGRKRLELLLRQSYSHTIIVDENDNLRCVMKTPFTERQIKDFPPITESLESYAGKRLTLSELAEAISECLAGISEDLVREQLEILFAEDQEEGTKLSELHCPSCNNILLADAIRCNKCGHVFI